MGRKQAAERDLEATPETLQHVNAVFDESGNFLVRNCDVLCCSPVLLCCAQMCCAVLVTCAASYTEHVMHECHVSLGARENIILLPNLCFMRFSRFTVLLLASKF